jgi:hypothetical protein
MTKYHPGEKQHRYSDGREEYSWNIGVSSPGSSPTVIIELQAKFKGGHPNGGSQASSTLYPSNAI